MTGETADLRESCLHQQKKGLIADLCTPNISGYILELDTSITIGVILDDVLGCFKCIAHRVQNNPHWASLDPPAAV